MSTTVLVIIVQKPFTERTFVQDWNLWLLTASLGGQNREQSHCMQRQVKNALGGPYCAALENSNLQSYVNDPVCKV